MLKSALISNALKAVLLLGGFFALAPSSFAATALETSQGYNYGRAAERQGKYGDAAAWYRHAIKTNPGLVQVRKRIAAVEYQQKNFPAALEEIELYLQAVPGDAEAVKFRDGIKKRMPKGQVLVTTSRKDLRREKAVRVYLGLGGAMSIGAPGVNKDIVANFNIGDDIAFTSKLAWRGYMGLQILQHFIVEGMIEYGPVVNKTIETSGGRAYKVDFVSLLGTIGFGGRFVLPGEIAMTPIVRVGSNSLLGSVHQIKFVPGEQASPDGVAELDEAKGHLAFSMGIYAEKMLLSHLGLRLGADYLIARHEDVAEEKGKDTTFQLVPRKAYSIDFTGLRPYLGVTVKF